ncbi:MAG TPA: DUF309 domain-containing protein [Vicinamibacteria bacterium]|nr:DUF309 domain-containing protein [Vicinamibacteria bacterium]
MRRYTDNPFPPYKHLPGQTPHPERDPGGYRFRKAAACVRALRKNGWHRNTDYLYGVDLFNAGYYWEAHAVWEELWRAAPASSRSSRFLQGLIQLAASSLKHTAGREAGATKLLQSALAKLERVSSGSPIYMGIEIPELLSQAVRPGEPIEIELEFPVPGRVLYSRNT